MTRLLIVVCSVWFVASCTHVSGDSVASRERASLEWDRNMAVIAESIQWWKNGSGTAPYTPDQITESITFFEELTKIYSGSMSFIGPIPNAQMEHAREEWVTWYQLHGDELTFDATSRRVLVAGD
jgi:hypothetical protein